MLVGDKTVCFNDNVKNNKFSVYECIDCNEHQTERDGHEFDSRLGQIFV